MKEFGYYGQDKETCGHHVDVACGPVSLANSLLMRGHDVDPKELCNAVVGPTLNHRLGLRPTELRQLSKDAGINFGISAHLAEPCSFEVLQAGDLIYINSVGLKNLQGGYEYEASEYDSHIVVVEHVSRTSLTVINPDCKKVGKGFTHDSWGRMKIPAKKLDSIWSTTRSDGFTTKKAAVLIRRLHDMVLVCECVNV